MKLSDCVPEKMSKLLIGVLLIIFALGAAVLGFTLLPFIGIILALVLFVLGGYFIRVHLNESCEISDGDAPEKRA